MVNINHMYQKGDDREDRRMAMHTDSEDSPLQGYMRIRKFRWEYL